MENFTFGIVTYNSSKTIIETLESIRYQVEQYANGVSISLIISDDCSTDNTLILVKQWLGVYGKLFTNTNIISTEQNSGVCRNYCQLLNNIQTDFYKTIAGDDLVCSHSIFDSINNLQQNEVRFYLPITFRGNTIGYDEIDIANHIYYMKKKHTNKIDLRNMVTISPYTTVELCIQRNNYTNSCINYLKQYRNFEDNTSLCYMFRENKELYLSYVFEPLILYRKSNTALSSGLPSMHQIQFLDDMHRFNKENLRLEKHIPTIFFLLLKVWESFLMKHRFDASKTLSRRLYKRMKKRIAQKTRTKYDYELLIKNLTEIVQKEQEFLKEIKTRADEFLAKNRNNGKI